MQNDRAKFKNQLVKPFCILNCNFNFLSLIFVRHFVREDGANNSLALALFLDASAQVLS